MSAGSATTIAAGSAGLVVMQSHPGRPVLAVVVIGAKGFMVADIACQQP